MRSNYLLNKKVKLFYFITVLMFLLSSCGNTPTSVTVTEYGAIALKSQVVQSLQKRKDVQSTSFDSIIIEIDATDFSQPIRKSFPFNRSSIAAVDTISSIPSGPSRVVKVWTQNTSGNIIHKDSIESHTLTIEPGTCKPIVVTLIPAVGSILLQLGAIPTSVDSITAEFISDSGQEWKTKVKRSNRVYLSIDNIPHLATGTVRVTTFNASGTQLHQASTRLTFNAVKCESVTLSFSTTGGSLAIAAKVMLPAVTVISASIGSSETTSIESGECIITEIMYSANDSEYVEIYNTTAAPLHYDTLTLEIDGTLRHFTDITLQSHDFFVFGRKNLPWADRYHSVQSALDLSSNGNWITLRCADKIIDQVIFSNGNDGLEWPTINEKRSIELDKEHYTPIDNNFGRFWKQAVNQIATFDRLFGTPGN
jgi:hypothetical protein